MTRRRRGNVEEDIALELVIVRSQAADDSELASGSTVRVSLYSFVEVSF